MRILKAYFRQNLKKGVLGKNAIEFSKEVLVAKSKVASRTCSSNNSCHTLFMWVEKEQKRNNFDAPFATMRDLCTFQTSLTDGGGGGRDNDDLEGDSLCAVCFQEGAKYNRARMICRECGAATHKG